jgi:hypothetical protein
MEPNGVLLTVIQTLGKFSYCNSLYIMNSRSDGGKISYYNYRLIFLKDNLFLILNFNRTRRVTTPAEITSLNASSTLISSSNASFFGTQDKETRSRIRSGWHKKINTVSSPIMDFSFTTVITRLKCNYPNTLAWILN